MSASPEDEKALVASARQLALFDELAAADPTLEQVWYGHNILTSTLFPAGQPRKGTQVLFKENGRVRYSLQPGIDQASKRPLPFPYGKYPRLIMAWMSKQIRSAGKKATAIVDPAQRTVTIPSISELTRQLGLAKGGATYRTLSIQLDALVNCSIKGYVTAGFIGNRTGSCTADFSMFSKVVRIDGAGSDPEHAYGDATYLLYLTEEGWRRLANETAPFDSRVLSYLLSKRSVMAFDVYIWVNGSMTSLTHPLTLTWDELKERFGDGINAMQDFRSSFRTAMKKVDNVYPGLRYLLNRKGLVLYPSPTAISQRG